MKQSGIKTKYIQYSELCFSEAGEPGGPDGAPEQLVRVPEAADGEVHHRAGPGQEPMLGAGLSLVSTLGSFYSASSAKYDS